MRKFLIASFAIGVSVSAAIAAPEIGALAPSFNATSAEGKTVSPDSR